MYAIIYRNDANDFEIWFPDLPVAAQKEVEAILEKYRDNGCSVRGTRNDIKEEL